ncbi:hypothetical protein M0R19_08930 [Candidatus Pacearchaeota archaeon]|nr:hypothetical protein [Candidatus Pacearchaeota archaeon]
MRKSFKYDSKKKNIPFRCKYAINIKLHIIKNKRNSCLMKYTCKCERPVCTFIPLSI